MQGKVSNDDLFREEIHSKTINSVVSIENVQKPNLEANIYLVFIFVSR